MKFAISFNTKHSWSFDFLMALCNAGGGYMGPARDMLDALVWGQDVTRTLYLNLHEPDVLLDQTSCNAKIMNGDLEVSYSCLSQTMRAYWGESREISLQENPYELSTQEVVSPMALLIEYILAINGLKNSGVIPNNVLYRLVGADAPAQQQHPNADYQAMSSLPMEFNFRVPNHGLRRFLYKCEVDAVKAMNANPESWPTSVYLTAGNKLISVYNPKTASLRKMAIICDKCEMNPSELTAVPGQPPIEWFAATDCNGEMRYFKYGKADLDIPKPGYAPPYILMHSKRGPEVWVPNYFDKVLNILELKEFARFCKNHPADPEFHPPAYTLHERHKLYLGSLPSDSGPSWQSNPDPATTFTYSGYVKSNFLKKKSLVKQSKYGLPHPFFAPSPEGQVNRAAIRNENMETLLEALTQAYDQHQENTF